MQKNSYGTLKALLAGKHEISADSYINSPLYYRITGRKGAKIYHNESSCVVTCHHPHIRSRSIVFPETGRADYKLTANVLNLMEEPENGIQLARITSEQIDRLRDELSKLNSSKAIELRPFDETYLDWRYPVRILDTRKVAEMKGPRFAKIRNKTRIAAQNVREIGFRQTDALRAMRAALKYWEGSMIFSSKETDSMAEFYEEFFDILNDYKNCCDGLIYLQGRKPVGFSVWEEMDKTMANLFINLGDSSITGLSDFQIVTSCKKLHEKGIARLNLGGSEIESLDRFKAKYQPVRSLPLFSADVIYERQTSSRIRVETLVPAAH